MKRILISIAAIILALSLLAGCEAPTKIPEGTVKGNVYTCQSAGITLTMPEGWAENLTPVYWCDDKPADLTAFSIETGSEIVIAYEDLAATGKSDCDEEAYFNFKSEEPSKSNGLTLNYLEYGDAKIGSNNFKVKHINYSQLLTGSDTYNIYFYIRREGSYMICIWVKINKDEDIDSIMANFS